MPLRPISSTNSTQQNYGQLNDMIRSFNHLTDNGTGMSFGTNPSSGGDGVIINKNGLKGYSSILGETFYLPTDGSAPTFSSGVINSTIFEINTNAVLRTSETVGDGGTDSHGILINNTGLYGCENNQTLANANVKVLVDGSASFKGTVTAGAGAIGGWTLSSTGLTASAGGVGLDSTVTAGDDIRIWAGSATPASAPFKVTEAGKLTATDATLSGSITATTGQIGGWSVNTTSIYTGTEDHSGYTANAGDMTIYSDGSDASIHAKNFYIDAAGALTATGVTVGGALTTGLGSSIDGTYIGTASIAGDKLTNATITATQIANATITGTQIANATVTGTQIAAATIAAANIVSATITGTQIAAATIAAANIANNTITASQIANNTVTATQIANNTIAAGQIANNTITASQIANNTVTAGQIANSTITSTQISATAGITGGQIAATTIQAGNIANTTITASQMANLTITAGQIANLTITSGKVNTALMSYNHNLVFSASSATVVAWATGTITMSDTTSYTISAGNTGAMSAKTYIYLAPGTSTTVLQTTTTLGTAVGDGKMLIAVAENYTTEAIFQVFNGIGGLNLAGSNIVTGSVTANEIAANTITATNMVAKTLTANEIAANTITGNEIAATTITGAKLVAGTITANEIAASTITAAQIAAATITTDKLSVANLSAVSANMGTITSGTITLDSTGYIRGGQTDFDTGTGVFLGRSGGDYKFSVGGATNALLWDGSSLTIKGKITATAPVNLKTYATGDLPAVPPVDTATKAPTGYV